MLNQIHIRDLATIEELHLNLADACTMITGETGAGKSIFIEAIELALGGRASSNMIRPGKDKAEISLSFDITRFPHVIECLTKSGFISLTHLNALSAESLPVMAAHAVMSMDHLRHLQFVKELGELLFHLHGQHEQQVMLKSRKSARNAGSLR